MVEPESSNEKLALLLTRLDSAIDILEQAKAFAKPGKLPRVLDTARRVIRLEGGCAALQSRAREIEGAGLFVGTDWEKPQNLLPALTASTLRTGNADTLVIEIISELRLLAVAQGDYQHPLISAEQAHHFLTQVLAVNLALLFNPPGEAEREQMGRLAELPHRLLSHLANSIGYEHVIDQLVDEIWR
ncbi:MAG: hypothetical protein RLN85_22035, partial [Pseudomonadales bacterium]